VARESSRPAIEVAVHRLGTIMKNAGARANRLAKDGHEGANTSSWRIMLACGIPVKQLLVEFITAGRSFGTEKTKPGESAR